MSPSEYLNLIRQERSNPSRRSSEDAYAQMERMMNPTKLPELSFDPRSVEGFDLSAKLPLAFEVARRYFGSDDISVNASVFATVIHSFPLFTSEWEGNCPLTIFVPILHFTHGNETLGFGNGYWVSTADSEEVDHIEAFHLNGKTAESPLSKRLNGIYETLIPAQRTVVAVG